MIYVADTTIIAEFLKKHPDPHVAEWAREYGEDIYLTTIALAQLHYDIERLPEGRRKDALSHAVRAISAECSQRVYDFDGFSAELCAELRCKAESRGFAPDIADCMTAAVCQRNGATLATHDVDTFAPFGIATFDPWSYKSPNVKNSRKREREDERQMTFELPS